MTGFGGVSWLAMIWVPLVPPASGAAASMVVAEPAVSPAFTSGVWLVLHGIPPEILNRLAGRGWRVEVVQSLGEALPELADRAPRGWPAGWTWRQVDAVHLPAERRLVVAAFRQDRSGARVSTTRTPSVIRHELGHAWDMAARPQGFLSSSPAFRTAYALDLKSMSAEHRVRLAYFVEDSSRGRQEAFAEAFAVLLGGGSAVHLQDEFRTAFPRVLRAVRTFLTAQGAHLPAGGSP